MLAGRMAQLGKVLGAQLEHLRWFPGRRGDPLLKVVLWPPHMCNATHNQNKNSTICSTFRMYPDPSMFLNLYIMTWQFLQSWNQLNQSIVSHFLLSIDISNYRFIISFTTTLE